MKKTLALMIFAALAVAPVSASAGHRHARFVPGPRCGGAWAATTEKCSFIYEGGQLSVGASATGHGAANVRLEFRNHVTGERQVLLSCTTPGDGACAAGGDVDVTESLRKGDRLFCIVEGAPEGRYHCSTFLRDRHYENAGSGGA